LVGDKKKYCITTICAKNVSVSGIKIHWFNINMDQKQKWNESSKHSYQLSGMKEKLTK
jgi:hypothetical protein